MHPILYSAIFFSRAVFSSAIQVLSMTIRAILHRISSRMTQTLTHSRSPSPNSPEPPKKKTKVENKPFESVDYSNGLHLAPMVRSGTCECINILYFLYLTHNSTNPARQFGVRCKACLDA